VQDVVEGYFDELAHAHEMLNSRYDDLKSGRVKPIPGDEVEAYFREKSAAGRMIAEVLSAIDPLVPFPGQVPKRPDLTSRPLRFILIREYLIAYAPEEKLLWVVAVMHGRRSPRVMASILSDRE